MTPPIPTTDAAQPPMLLIVPESRLEDLPAIVYAGIQACAAAYSRGRWFVEVPHALYAAWPAGALWARLEGVPT